MPRGSRACTLLFLLGTVAAHAEALPVPPAPVRAPVVHKAALRHRRPARPAAEQAYNGPAVLPQSSAASRFETAPTPSDASAPVRQEPPQIDTEPKLFTVKTQFKGDGFPYGATSQGLDDKYQVQVPGVNVTVPLRQ